MVRILLLLTALASCSLLPDSRPSQRIVIASWNVENLFDEIDDGTEYSEFDPGKGWTRAQFWARCDSLARVIRGDLGVPDVLVLEEIENSHTLGELRTRFLGDAGYRYWFIAPDEVAGVKTAVLSRFPLVRTGLHFPAGDGYELRPLVEVEVNLGGRALVLLGNHWKSRIPSPAATEGLRRDAARVLARRIAALEAREDRPYVAALGDFNTSVTLSQSRPDKALISGGAYDGSQVGLAVFSNHQTALDSHWPGAVWEPWDGSPGTYLYQKDWDRLDHVFVAVSSLRLTDWRFDSFRVAAYAPTPQAYGPRTPNGVSDHFPVVLTLARRSGASP